MATTTDTRRTTALSESKRALLARRLLGQADHTAARTIPPRPTGPIPLSPAQRAVWLADQLFDGGAAYTVHRTMTVRGVLDLGALRQAADLLVARHEILRTTIYNNHQVVHPAAPACFTVVSPPGATAGQRRTTALHEARLAVATPFDLEAGPLLRFTVYRVDDEEFLVVISQHHIITDGWSCALLAKELCETYTAVVTGRLHQAPPPVQFGDIAAWQAAVPPERLREDLDYWADALAGLPDGLQLPLDRTRPPRRSDRGETFVALLPAALSTQVRTLAGQRGSTVHNVLLTAYAALLARYSTQEQFAVGSLLSGRGAPETEHALGLFANTVAIPMNLAGRPTFAEALARTNRAVRGALDHQDVAFDQIVTRVGAVRDASRNPIFQVIFQCVEAAEETWQLPEAVVQHVDLDNGTAKVDLTMIAVNGGTGEIGLELSFATDLFDRATIDRFVAHFVALLEQVVAEPDAPLDSVELVTGAERDTMLREWNDTEVTYPDLCVHELFERQAAATPLATAIIEHDGKAVTYAQLNARANRVAHLLRARGVGVEDVVGLCLPQSTDLHATLLGILKAGGCYLPLDPAHPAERQRYMLSDAGARILMTAADTHERFADFDGERICVPTEDLSGYAGTDPETVTTPDNLIYVMYTSGSTGRPKGVLVTHRGVANYLLWSIDGYGVQGASGAPMVGSIAFDLSVPNFLLPLISGRDVTLLPETDQVQTLANLIQRDGDYSLLKITPGHLDALRHLTPAGSRVNSVRTYVVGADEVRPETVTAWREIAPQGRIINEYGPTETVVGCSVYEIGDDFDPASPISIGRPIANLRMYVLDAQGRLAPPGIVGELYIGGVGVARGYAGRPALTAERFVPDPYDPLPGARMYRTGDLARFHLDGNIGFLGRIDHQVKIRGYRVELAEVEARLLAHPEVTEAVVVCREAGGHQRLAAYVVGTAGAAVEADGVKRFVAAGLPEYMVPSVVTVLDQLPLTSGGKVDRAALPDPVEPVDTDKVTPRTDIERLLAGIWSRVLGVSEIGIHDNFFALGGDSLLSIRTVGEARAEGLDVTPALLFSHQTVAELAAAAATRPMNAVSAEQAEVSGPAPLTPIEHWFTAQDLHHDHYNQAVRVAYPDRANVPALREAIRTLLRHHDGLRVTMARDEGGWRKSFAAKVGYDPLIVVDLPADEPEAMMHEIATGAHTGLSLTEGRLLTAVLFRHDGSDELLLAVHHTAVDRIGWEVLLSDLDRGYHALIAGRQPELPAKTTSARQWAQRLAGYAHSDGFRDEAQWWQGYARELAELPGVPLDRPGGANRTADAATAVSSLSAEQTEVLLRRLPGDYRASVEEILLTALARATGDVWNLPGVVVDLETHGREPLFDDVDLSRTVGWFTALHPVGLHASGARPADWVRSVKDTVRKVPHRGIGYGIARYLGTGLPDVGVPICFNYLSTMDGTTAGGLGVERSLEGRRPYLLEITAYVADGRLWVGWTYATSCHAPQTVARLTEAFHAAVDELARGAVVGLAAASPSDFPLADLDQRHLDELSAQGALADVEDVYRLTPLQIGMLFQSTAAPNRGDYVEGFVFAIDGDLDAAALRGAWQAVIARHAVLRTSFRWRGLPHPVQLVHRTPALRWLEMDWQSMADPERADALARLLAADRRHGFRLDAAPPLRFYLIRTGPAEYRLVWVFHHILLDGWSTPLVLADVLEHYRAGTGDGRVALAPAVPLRDYVAWLTEQPAQAAADYWRQELAGVGGPTPISVVVPDNQVGDAEGAGVCTARGTLTVAETAAIRRCAQEHRVTPGTLLQAAWALLLARDSGLPEVVFGTTSAGRSGSLDGIDRVVGVLMNTLPTRVTVTDTDLGEWLRGLQAQQVAMREYEYCALTDVQRAAGVPAGRPMFDSIFVYENFAGPDAPGWDKLSVRLEQAHEQTGYPLVLGVGLHDQVMLRLNADRTRVVDEQAAPDTLAAYVATLRELVEPGARLVDLAPTVDPTAVTANGSPASAATAVRRDVPHVAPEGETARAVATIWAEVLRTDRVGMHDDFVDLGGDSVKAMQIVGRARDIGLIRRPRDLFRRPTLAAFLAEDGNSVPSTPSSTAPTDVAFPLADLPEPELAALLSRVGAGEVEDVYPLAPLQAGMVFHRLTASKDLYLLQFGSDLHGELDIAQFIRAWQHVVDRHAGLRTLFAWDGLSHPVQVVLRHFPVPVEQHDWRGVPAAELDDRLDRLVASERTRGMDIEEQPPLRLVLVRIGEATHRLLWNSHHVAIDGWSQRIIVREVIQIYRALRTSEVPPAQPAPHPREYLNWLHHRDTQQDEAYWRETLDRFPGATPPPLASAQPASGGGRIERPAPDGMLAGLQALAKAHRVTLNSILHAAWALLLGRQTGCDDVVFGSTIVGRSADVPGIQGMVTTLMNSVPTRIRLDAPAFGDWLRQVQGDQLTQHEHGHCSLGQIRRAAGLGRESLFHSLLVFYHFNADEMDYGDESPPSDLDLRSDEPPYPLKVTAELNGALRLGMEFQRAHYDDETVGRLLDEYTAVLHTFTATAADTPVEKISPADDAVTTLCGIWTALLRLTDVKPDSDFFALGGDSILAFEAVSQARRAGLDLKVPDLLRHPTPVALAALLRGEPPLAAPEAVRPASGVGRLAPGAELVRSAMAEHHVPAVSIAVIEGGEIVRAWGEGVTKAGGTIAVGARTAFQVCSVSKHVTAAGVLRLVRDGALDLDEDARAYLRTWRLPDARRVTIGQLLSHTAGLTRVPNPGYPPGEAVPSLPEVLSGAAGSRPVRVELEPGAEFRYSGAHYSALQQIVTDVTRMPYPEAMRDLVFTPLGMTDSGFDPEFPLWYPDRVAHGHLAGGTPLPGGWRTFPELASTGLWTTATDLARLSCALREAVTGARRDFLDQNLATRMLTPASAAAYGLGCIALERDGRRWYGHSGDGDAYQALSLGVVEDGTGVIVLANVGGDLRFATDLLAEVQITLPSAEES
ncbi:non-ribosomal peptide synthetase [Micromonospora sp. WMMC273]|uniref:non-ribosomal peptide synthetase n=1 Tax=Micromonospora sp. WMMC273 TaxID=3015157 RepID=UPI0022B646EA|nr:non-ribosomal peptide synthetase [Micromonospora sp. WMMC273]MCZ7476254.1 amino acid adenylation domain-containing protein [Micromonospora sp. WMMC273]